MNLFTYEKGYCFVYYLSQLCGDPQRFDDFLRVSSSSMGTPCPSAPAGPAPGPLSPAPTLPLQAYVDKYKFTSVVAQDLLDSFLSFFPELKEQSVDCRAGEAHRLPHVPPAAVGAAGIRRGAAAQDAPSAGRKPLLPAANPC